MAIFSNCQILSNAASVILVLIVTSSTDHDVHAQTAVNVTRLDLLLGDVSPRIPPSRNLSEPTPVSVAVNLLAINELDTATQTLTLVAWFSITWTNQYLTWDPADYGGATYFYPDPEKIWFPPVVVMNTKNEIKTLGHHDRVTARANGSTTWYPGDVISTACRVDVTHFPFDEHTCLVKLGVWSEPGTALLEPEQAGPDLTAFTESSEWSLTEASLRAEWIQYADDKSGVRLVLILSLKRRASTLVLTVLLPVALLAAFNVIVFLIPCQSGERISFAITVLLSYGVFLKFVTDVLPSATESLSILVTFLYLCFVLSALFVILSVISVRLYHLDEYGHPVPASLAYYIVCLEKFVYPVRQRPKNRVSDGSYGGSKDKGRNSDGKVKAWMGAGDRQEKVQREEGGEKMRRDDAPARPRQPDEVTWKRVVLATDAFFFRMFLVGFVIASAVTATTVRFMH